jgi:hypothetical protein
MIRFLLDNFDVTLALGLVVAAVCVVILTQIGLLPRKSLGYVIVAAGAAIGWSWMRRRQADSRREELKKEEARLKALEGELAAAGRSLGDANVRLDAAHAEFEARRTAITESIVELDDAHRQRLAEISGLSGEALDSDMQAMLARVRVQP